jgi:cyanophycinase
MTITDERTRTAVPATTGGRGIVMPIGGAEETRHDPDVLTTFLGLAGGAQARIALIPSASSEPQDAIDKYTQVFKELGAAQVAIVHGETQRAFERDEMVELLEQATGIFISGGDQNRLAELLCGTPVADAIIERNRAGVVVAGTSAGAAIMASHMVEGGASDSSPTREMSAVTEGLGLLQNLVVDTHFGERGRTNRLIAMHSAHPDVVSIGLDENTAAVIDSDMLMRVVGGGSVTIVDGSSIRTDLEERRDDELIMVNGVEIHIVTTRYSFDLRACKFAPPLRNCYTQ